MIYKKSACPEHVDILIEEYVNEYELAPELDVVEEKTKAPCSWCEQDAVYMVSQLDAEEDT